VDEVRFRLRAADEAERRALDTFIDGCEGVEVLAPRDVIGAPLADPITAALIMGGASVLASVISAFATWMIARRAVEQRPIEIVLRGVEGTARLSAEQAQDGEIVAEALDGLGGLMEVAEGGRGVLP
jgi:hypothetical protein